MTATMTEQMPVDATRRQRLAIRVVLGGLGRLTSSPSDPSVPRPTDDDFYRQDADSAARGQVLDVRPVEVRGRKPLDVPAWQIRFASTNLRDEPVAGVTTVIRPLWSGTGPQPVVSYQAAIDSLSDRGAPSWRLRAGCFADLTYVQRLLKQGWAVITTDFHGPRHSFGLYETAGRLMLDGIQAACAADVGLDPQAPLGLWGYSGGADASLSASELAASYAPDVRISAVAAGGTPVTAKSVQDAADGGLFFGLAITIVMGLAREFPEVDLDSVLTDGGRAVVARLEDSTTDEAMGALPYRHWSDLLTVGSLEAVPGMPEVFERVQRGGAVPSGDLYFYHPLRDQLCPYELAAELVEHYRSQGVTVELKPIRLVEHILGIPVGAGGAIRFLAAKLDPSQ